MLEGFIGFYLLVNVFSIVVLAINTEEIYDDIEEYGFKVKHLVTVILVPLAVIAILLVVLAYIGISTVANFISLSKIMNKSIWKNK